MAMPSGSATRWSWRWPATPALQDTRVVLLTARGQSQDRDAGESAGADEYLIKPFSPLQLIETIERLDLENVDPVVADARDGTLGQFDAAPRHPARTARNALNASAR